MPAPRFTLTRRGFVSLLSFDDGGMNLLSSSALQELSACVDHLAADGSTHVLLFRSARPGLFAAGADMAEMRLFNGYDADSFSRLGQELFARVERLPFTTVAEIDGDCFGGALDLAMAFDLRIATGRSRFSHPGAKIGIVTGFAGTARWRRVIEPAAARRLFLSGDVLTASEAHAVGLVNECVAGLDELHDPRLELLAAEPSLTRMIKEVSVHAGGLTQSDLLLFTTSLRQLYFGAE